MIQLQFYFDIHDLFVTAFYSENWKKTQIKLYMIHFV